MFERFCKQTRTVLRSRSDGANRPACIHIRSDRSKTEPMSSRTAWHFVRFSFQFKASLVHKSNNQFFWQSDLSITPLGSMYSFQTVKLAAIPREFCLISRATWQVPKGGSRGEIWKARPGNRTLAWRLRTSNSIKVRAYITKTHIFKVRLSRSHRERSFPYYIEIDLWLFLLLVYAFPYKR